MSTNTPTPARRREDPASQLTLTAHALFFLGAICGACLTIGGGILLIVFLRLSLSAS